MHEDYRREHEIGPGPDRSFGLTIAVALAAIAFVPVYRHRPPRLGSLAAAVMFAVVALTRPSILRPLNRLWFKLGLVLNRITSPVLLAAVLLPGCRSDRTDHASRGQGSYASPAESAGHDVLDFAQHATKFHDSAVLTFTMSIVNELWSFLRVRKKFWLLPLVAVLLLVGALLVLTQSSALAPFIYTIF